MSTPAKKIDHEPLQAQINYVINVDVDSIKKEKTPEGYLIHYNVPIARTGLFTYKGYEFFFPKDRVPFSDQDDVVVLRTSNSFTEEVIKSSENMPLTNEHPRTPLDNKTTKSSIVGVTGDKSYFESPDLFAGKIIVYDEDSVNQIESGEKKELSIGFEAVYDFTQQGEYEGKRFIGTETIRRINHISLVKRGKAGSYYRMHHQVDDKKSEPNTQENINMSDKLQFINVGGVDIPVTPEKFAEFNQVNTKNEIDNLKNSIIDLTSSVSKISDAVSFLVKNKEEESKKEKEDKEDKKDACSKNKKDKDMEDKKHEKEEDEDDAEDKKHEKSKNNSFSASEKMKEAFSKNAASSTQSWVGNDLKSL